MSAPRNEGLCSASFLGLLSTQLLTAVNDNVFRWLVIGIGKTLVARQYGPGHEGSILAAGTTCFVFPYLIFAATAGYLADAFSKKRVILGCKFAEIVIMGLGILAIYTESLVFLFVVVAVMGAQSAIFSPSKLGCIPELLKPEKISAANGLFGLTTVGATVVGMGLGNWLSDLWQANPQANIGVCALVVLGIAVIGTGISFLIRSIPAADSDRCFPWNPFSQSINDLRLLFSYRALFRVALGIVFFWSVGSLAQMNIDQFASESGARLETDKIPLLVALVFGVGFGSVLAGILSRGRVELGILPLGAIGIAVSSLLLFTVPPELFGGVVRFHSSLVWTCWLLFTLGFSAGMFHIPLQAFMQDRSPANKRGSILAANNFITFSGILIFAIAFSFMRMPIGADDHPALSTRTIFLFSGLATIPVVIYVICLIPQSSLRFIVWLTSLFVYRIKVKNHQQIPQSGGAVMVANHVSWLDGAFLLATSSRPIRFLSHASKSPSRFHGWLARICGVILIPPDEAAARRAVALAEVAVANGELVCVFPEGEITRTGELQGFQAELSGILETEHTVIPVFLDGLWGSIFSFERGRMFWKLPRKLPYPISIYFGEPMVGPKTSDQVRQALLETCQTR
jgi:acyl-[acyl-carrier-protein]-phospholipid O-acyltransferase/long-chain-fatty-acid--[acyl-carrier-protein] ligase